MMCKRAGEVTAQTLAPSIFHLELFFVRIQKYMDTYCIHLSNYITPSRCKPPQSSPPICCLRCLSSLSLVAVFYGQRPPSFQFIVCHRHRRHRCRRHHRHLLLAVDIITIYCPSLPCLLSPVPLLVSCRASSPQPSSASTLTSSEIGQRWMGGGVRLTAWRN